MRYARHTGCLIPIQTNIIENHQEKKVVGKTNEKSYIKNISEETNERVKHFHFDANKSKQRKETQA